MGDRAREIALPIAERLEGIRAMVGPFSVIGGAREYVPVWGRRRQSAFQPGAMQLSNRCDQLASPAFMGTSVRKITIFKSLQCKVLH